MSVINKEERALLVVANLSNGGDPRLQKLYEWFDANAINVAELILDDEYHHIDTLTGNHVTKANFINRIIANAQDPQIKALDVVLVLHGPEGRLFFDDGGVRSSDLKDDIGAANLKHRLRLLYSTACYAASHAQDFVDAGFRTASGALKVCANGPYDYPAQLYNWKEGKTYKSTVKTGNNPLWMTIHDKIAEALGFDDVDSEKIIKGKKYTRITTEAL
jgi:hypothetical protein